MECVGAVLDIGIVKGVVGVVEGCRMSFRVGGCWGGSKVMEGRSRIMGPRERCRGNGGLRGGVGVIKGIGGMFEGVALMEGWGGGCSEVLGQVDEGRLGKGVLRVWGGCDGGVSGVLRGWR